MPLGAALCDLANGHGVEYVAELDPRVTDEAVLQRASQSEALLLTNEKSLGGLVFRQGRAQAGVMLLRLAGLSAAKKAAVVATVIREHSGELESAFAVVRPGQVRIRTVP